MKEGAEVGALQRQGPSAKSKARLARFEELSDVDYQRRNETNEIFIPVAERLGNEVIEFKGVTKSFGDRVLIDNLSFKVPPGAIVGIIGPNGAGKSTLFRMIQGTEKPDKGVVKIGKTAKLAFVDQSRASLAADQDGLGDVSGGLDNIVVGKFVMPSRAYLGRFNFKGNDQQKLVGNLSGGERGRLHLAKTLAAGRQRADARRTLQRPRRRNPARAGRGAARVRRLGHGHQPRPLVPGPHLHAHPGLRGREPVGLLRRQLPANTRPTRSSAWARRARVRSACASSNRGAAMTHGEWLVFCHDDIRFLRADFAARLALALQRFDVCGPAGATHLVGPAVLWGGPANGLAQVTYPLPDGRYAATLCGIGPVHARAEALDGVFIAVKRRVWEQVRFDADRFDAFHLYDIDFSYSCHRRGHVVGIAQDLHLLHDSDGSFDERWSIFADRFVRKHNLVVAEAHPNPTGGLIVDDCARIAAMFDALNAA
jgi:hypothetical protein